MQSGQYPIRSRLPVRSNVSGNEAAAESAASDQNTFESSSVGEVEESENTETIGESEIVQDAQNESESDQGSGTAPDPIAPDDQSEAGNISENNVHNAQNQEIGSDEESGDQEQDAEQSENVKEVIKEIIVTQQQETDVQTVQTVVAEPDYIISTDEYRVTSILLLAAVLGAIIATDLLNVINRGL